MIGLIEQMAINGLMAGLVYTLMALGFTLVFGIMRMVNFAHGEFYMVGAFAVLALNSQLGMGYFPAVVLATIITAMFGATVERVLYRPFVGRELGGMIMSLAVGITLQALALIFFGPADLSVDRPVTGIWRLHEAVIPLDRALVAVCAVVALVIFQLFLRRTRMGLAMQAVAQDRETASLMGVEAGSVYLRSFAIAAALAGLAGALMAPVYTVAPTMGELPMLKAFVVVILGGLGSVPGAVLGGLLIGLSESVFSTMFNTTLALIASFVIVLAVIIVKPNGLLARGGR